MKFLIALLCTACTSFLAAQNVEYAYPVKLVNVNVGNAKHNMAYMFVQPYAEKTGKTILLLHGKNFSGFYWRKVIPVLVAKGYSVVVPDQLGFGKSDKPIINYSFDTLAKATMQLLDSIKVNKVYVVGHSMGGMLATNIALLYPERVAGVVFENPIGIEDYSNFVRPVVLDSLIMAEKKATYTSYKKYQQTYYPKWKPEYEQYVKAQAAILKQKNFEQVARVNALTYKMIYDEPVVDEFHNIQAPALIIIGQADRTIVGKQYLSKDEATKHGNYPELGRWLQKEIKNAKLIELAGVGHIPHIQSTTKFNKELLNFLETN